MSSVAASPLPGATPVPLVGNDRILLGLVLGLLSFWLFAQTALNIAPDMRRELGLDAGTTNIAVAMSSLFAGIFVVVMGGLADRVGRVRITRIGFGLAIAGSLLVAVTPTGNLATPVLLLGRALQGASAACILPASLALVKAGWEGAARQRAISMWAIYRFDMPGVLAFVVAMFTLQVLVTQGSTVGWASPLGLGLAAITVVAGVVFMQVERRSDHAFFDFGLFRHRVYTGATLSNFLVNGAAGTLVVSLQLVQTGGGMNAQQAGLLTLGYAVAIISFIRVGEKLLQRFGPRRPMLWGCLIAGTGIALLMFTHLPHAMAGRRDHLHRAPGQPRAA